MGLFTYVLLLVIAGVHFWHLIGDQALSNVGRVMCWVCGVYVPVHSMPPEQEGQSRRLPNHELLTPQTLSKSWLCFMQKPSVVSCQPAYKDCFLAVRHEGRV